MIVFTAVLSTALLLLPALPANAAAPTIVNSAGLNWLESLAVPKDTTGQNIFVTVIVKHDVGQVVTGLAIDDDWNGTDNSGTVAPDGVVATQLPGGASNYSAVRYAFTPPNMPGFSCSAPFSGTRRVNQTLRLRAVTSDGQRTAPVTASVHSVENNQCTGPDDYPFLFDQSQNLTSVVSGQTVTFNFRGDDADQSGTNDAFDKYRWRWIRLSDGVASGLTNVDLPGSNSDNVLQSLNVSFPSRGRYVVEADLGGESDGFGDFANAGAFFRIGAVDVNTAAATSPTVSLTHSATLVQAGSSFTVTAAASDSTDSNGRVQMIRWDRDGIAGFEDREFAADETTGLSAAQLSRTVTTTAGQCADRTITAEVTDNGAMNGADAIRRLKTASTTVVVNCAPVANPNSFSTPEDTPLTVGAPGVLGNDTDGDGDALTAQLVSGPTSGTLNAFNANGSFTYTPAPNFNGTATFQYRALDATSSSNTTTVTINVTGVNDAPTANNDAYSTNEDTPLNVTAPGVLANDTDPDGNPLTAVLGTPPSSGTLVLNPNGSFTYTPAPNFSGVVTFTYRASDGSALSNLATVTITVNAVNDAPTANNDAYSTSEDTPLNVAPPGVLANDTDPEGATLTAQLVSGPSSGTLFLNPNGGFSYTPAANFSGIVTFTYRASDGSALSNVATVTITVNAVNDAPTANNDAYSTSEDTPLSEAAPGVLGNDTDPDGNPLTASVVSFPANGTLAMNANGSFTYTPNANFHGTDSFTYRASDGSALSNVATVTITVTSVNDAPVAVNDVYETDEDVTLNVPAPGVLGNDFDVDGDALTAVLVSGPSDGSLTFNSDGSFSYTPDPNFNGFDSFTYVANDGSANSNSAPATITINAVNDAPVGVNDGFTTNEDTPLNVAPPGVLGNDFDVDGDPLTAVLESGPANGTLVLNADGSFTYTPDANFNGLDSFTYRASDGELTSDIVTVSLTINPVNDAPVGVNDSYTTDEDVPLNVSPPGVLGNDSDVDGDTLTAVLASGPSDGTLVLNADGSFTYTPDANFNGTDSFTYRASDGELTSNLVTVSLTINAVNDAPVANDDAYSTAEDTPLVVAAPGVLSNDTDVDGDPLTAVLVSGPSDGSLVLNADGSFIYSPDPNFNGSDSFSYKANDGELDSNTAPATITITAVNDAPACANGSGSTPEGSALSDSVSCSDVENDALIHSVVSGSTDGSIAMDPDGSFTYTPDPSFTGTDSFTFKANDGALDSNVATFTITVTDVLPPSPTVTKTANPGSVPAPGGPGVGQVDYTVTVTHPSSAVEPVTITALTDSAFGNLNGQGTCATGSVLDPSETYTCTFTGVVSGGVGSSHTNTVTATVQDDENNTASGSGSATVTVVAPTAKVSPAFTTCSQYKGGSAQDLNEIRYTVQDGKISAVSGQLFYFSKITATSANFTLDIGQTRDNASLPLFGVQAAQTKFYSSLCAVSPKGTITIAPNGSNVNIAVTGALPNEVFYVAIMYAPQTTIGTAVTQPYPTATYRFETKRNGVLIPSSRESVLFKPV